MSKNQARKIQPNTTRSDSANQKSTSKSNSKGFIVGLVPQRTKNCTEKVYQQLMEEYAFHLRRLEMVKKLRDCLNGHGDLS